MSKWDKRDEIRALKRKADETTDPFKIFESMIKLGYVKCSWDVLHKMCSSKLEMEYSRDGVQPEGELDVRQHSSNLEDYCERVEFVEEK
jgi:hypothetical protein